MQPHPFKKSVDILLPLAIISSSLNHRKKHRKLTTNLKLFNGVHILSNY